MILMPTAQADGIAPGFREVIADEGQVLFTLLRLCECGSSSCSRGFQHQAGHFVDQFL